MPGPIYACQTGSYPLAMCNCHQMSAGCQIDKRENTIGRNVGCYMCLEDGLILILTFLGLSQQKTFDLKKKPMPLVKY